MRENDFFTVIRTCVLLLVSCISGLVSAQLPAPAPEATEATTPGADTAAVEAAVPSGDIASPSTASTAVPAAPAESAQPAAAPIPPPAPEKKWYVVVNGASAGPFNEAEMNTRIQQGVIQPNTQIAEVGNSQWVSANTQFSNFPQATAPVSMSSGNLADPRPSSGIGAVVTGSILLGVGALNLVTIPVCFMDSYPEASQDLCVGLSAGLGGTLVSVGLPLLIVGVVKRKRFKAWRRRNTALMNFSIAANDHFGGLTWHYQF